MKTHLDFLILARRCEMAELQQLSRTSAMVQHTARLIHELQRERGLSNLYLASGGERFASALQEQVQLSQEAEADLRTSLAAIGPEGTRWGHGARLYSRVAYVLHGLDALPTLRLMVRQMRWALPRSLASYIRLVASLLSVVFEAADGANEAEISRRLVALFNFMQGKEYAGQERATGAALYAGGQADGAPRQHLLHLIDAQERCLDVFSEFASQASRDAWAAMPSAGTLAELERMRRVLCTARDGSPLDSGLGEVWFNCCSRRMGEMKAMEDALVAELLHSCDQRMAQVSQELDSLQSLCDAIPDPAPSAQAQEAAESFFADDAPAPHEAPRQVVSSGLDRSVVDLLQQQARRLQQVGEELSQVRASLDERKLIERAKGLLMAHRKLSEEDAHQAIRRMAMNQKRRLVDVADAVLTSADILPPVALH